MTLVLHPDARRFECASPPYPSVYAFRAALKRARSTGPDALLERRIITRTIPQPACVRASFHPANSTAEIDALLSALDTL